MRVFVWDVFYHYCGSAVLPTEDRVKIQHELVGVFDGRLRAGDDLVTRTELAHAELHLWVGHGHHFRVLEGWARLAEQFLSGAGLSMQLTLHEMGLECRGVCSLTEYEGVY